MADGRGPQLEGALIALFVLSVVSVSLRIYTHGVILRHFYAEDWLSLATLALYAAFTAFGLVAVSYGLGEHNVDVPPDDHAPAIMYRWLAEISYIVISTMTKWIVGLFLLRICPNHRWRKITIWTILGAVTLFNIIFFFIAVFSCQPVEYEWTRYLPVPPDGTCNATTFATITTYVASFLNVLGDWVLPALPATLVWKAQMSRQVKVSVVGLLALGSIASIATIVRIPYAKGILDNPDYLYTFTDLGIWSTVEIGVALTASSLATLKPLMRKMNLFSSSSSLDPSGWTSEYARGSRARGNSVPARGNTVTIKALKAPEPEVPPKAFQDSWWRGRGRSDGSEGDMELVEEHNRRVSRSRSPSRTRPSDVEAGEQSLSDEPDKSSWLVV